MQADDKNEWRLFLNRVKNGIFLLLISKKRNSFTISKNTPLFIQFSLTIRQLKTSPQKESKGYF